MDQQKGIELYWKQAREIPLLTNQKEIDITTGMQKQKKAFQTASYRLGLKFYIDLISEHSSSTLFISKKDTDKLLARTQGNLETIMNLYDILRENYPPRSKKQKEQMQKRLRNAEALMQELPIYPPKLLKGFDFLKAISRYYAGIMIRRNYISKHKDNGQEKKQELEQLCKDILFDIYKFKPTMRKYRTALEKYESLKAYLISANLRLCFRPVKANLDKGLDELDLIQEGNKGLIRAAYLFLPELGNRFSTYAVYWIRQSINRAIQNNKKIIRKPVHLSEAFQRIGVAESQFISRYEREPTDSELLDIVSRLYKSETTLNDIEDYKERKKLLSLDAVNADDEPYFEIQDKNSPNPTEELTNKEKREKVNQTLKQLSARKREVLERAYGINGPQMNLKQIGDVLYLTRERIRQIKGEATKDFIGLYNEF